MSSSPSSSSQSSHKSFLYHDIVQAMRDWVRSPALTTTSHGAEYSANQIYAPMNVLRAHFSHFCQLRDLTPPPRTGKRAMGAYLQHVQPHIARNYVTLKYPRPNGPSVQSWFAFGIDLAANESSEHAQTLDTQAGPHNEGGERVESVRGEATERTGSVSRDSSEVARVKEQSIQFQSKANGLSAGENTEKTLAAEEGNEGAASAEQMAWDTHAEEQQCDRPTAGVRSESEGEPL